MDKNIKSQTKIFKRNVLIAKLSNKIFKRILLLLFTFLTMSIVLIVNFIPQERLKIGERSPKDIKAPRSAKYIDIEETKKIRQEKLKSIKKVYEDDPQVLVNIEYQIKDIFEKAIAISSERDSISKKTEHLKRNLHIDIPNSVITYILETDREMLLKLKRKTIDIIRDVMSHSIRSDVPYDIELAKKMVGEKVGKLQYSEKHKEIIFEIAEKLIQPNTLYNERETERLKEYVLSKTKPVIKTISAGETIVHKDEIVSPLHIAKLQAVGVMSPKINILIILYIAILNFSFLAIFIYFTKQYYKDIFLDEKMLFLISLLSIFGLVFSKFLSYISTGFLSLLPLISISQIITIFVNPVLSFIVSLILNMQLGLILSSDLRFVILGILSCIIASIGVSNVHKRADIVKAGLLVCIVNLICIMAFSIISADTFLIILTNISIGFINGIGSSILTIGGVYFLEKPFGISSPLKLLEIGSVEEPLMKRLMMEAPGTYNHSVYVGNLAESAAAIVDANPLLVRIGSYYHDIGKIKRPYFFVENQINIENLHEKISPSLSASIIKAHVQDGVEIAKQYGLPPKIIDIIAEHHGSGLISYFYQKMEKNDENILEEHFRYDGRKPQSKESALVMLADCVEAAARTLVSPDSEKIQTLVKKVITNKLQDGQFDESNLTFQDINKIIAAFTHLLESMFHTRIEYPQEKTKENREKQDNV